MSEVFALVTRRNILRQKIKDCVNCPLGGRGNNVAFYGNVHSAKLIVIGEAAGENEVLQSRPFVGRAGKLLWSELAKHKIGRADTFSMNALSCRSISYLDGQYKNRTPTQIELDKCDFNFVNQLALVSHCRFILALGNTALHKFRPDARIGDWNGKPLYIARGEKPARIVVPGFHPAAVLRNPDLHDEFSEAIGLLIAMVNLGDAYGEIWPVQCNSCGSDEVFQFEDAGVGWCGPCWLVEFQDPLPGIARAKPTKLKLGRKGEVGQPKRNPTRRIPNR